MFYKKNDINMYYEVYGNKNKKVILILPGWGKQRRTFEHIINYYQNNYKVIIVDYPGFGNTKFPSKDLTIYDYSNLIENFIKDNNIYKPIIIAHSFGGRIATILAAKKTNIAEKMIFIDTAGIRRKSIKRKIKEIIYKIRKKLVLFIPKKKKIKYLKSLRKTYSSNDYNNLNNNMYQTFKNIIKEDLRKYIKKIKIETLLLWGYLDQDTPINDGFYFNKHIDKSALIIFPKGTHFTYLEYKQETINIIDNFLEY